eukprot:GHVL01023718.1.p1 GENE.GHVL01023718.1~~GHVL01023718.1.p1  ORF type:complete len:208 (+),score=14.80 GHVL01023718.1:1006-1629(+)
MHPDCTSTHLADVDPTPLSRSVTESTQATSTDSADICTKSRRISKNGYSFEEIMFPLQSSYRVQQLVADIDVLSKKVFDSNAAEGCSRKKGFRMMVVTRDDNGLQKLAGFVKYRLNAKESYAEIIKMAIVPELRSCGIGRSLLKACISRIKQEKKYRLLCLSSLKEAVNFYKKMGFKEDRSIQLIAECHVEGQVYMEINMIRRKRHF